MAEKEERILIARSTDYTISDTKDGALFEGKIAPHNANVFSRQEAIERMAKAMCVRDNGISCDECIYKNSNNCKTTLENWFIEDAEAALNALLEGK